MELHILPRLVQQMEEAIHYLVLTDSLVTDQQEVLTEDEVFQHGRHDVQMLQIKEMGVVSRDVRPCTNEAFLATATAIGYSGNAEV